MSSVLTIDEPRPGHHDTNIKNSAWHGLSELHQAAMDTPDKVRTLLLNGADVTARNNYGETALHYACQSGNWGGVFQLLLFEANLYDVDNGGRMCIHHAARSGCLLTIQYLEFLGINMLQRDKRGRTVLHVAVEHGHHELIKYLIQQKIVDLRVKDSKLLTPMHVAVHQNDRHVCWMLESNSNESLINDKDHDGKTPLDYAMTGVNNLKLTKTLRRWQKMRNAKGKLTVPTISRFASFVTPSASTLCVAFFVWYFNSRLVSTLLSLIVLIVAYFYAMKPHRLWHVSREPNPGLCGWFFGSVVISLSIYFTLVLPKIWPDYGFTIFALVVCAAFAVSTRKVYADPGLSKETKVDKDGHPMGIIDVVSARISSHAYCARCKTACPYKTKHCRLCDYCYKGLDHHCLFIMTCVAINNHGAFLAMVISVFTAQFSFVRGALFHFFTLAHSHQELSYLSVLGMEPLISVYLVINCLGLWFTLTLMLFQLKNISEGGTTCFLPNGELRTRIDCFHAAGTIGELTIARRLQHLKQFIQFHYFAQTTISSHDKLLRV